MDDAGAIEQVRQEIIRAFASLPVPDAKSLIATSTGDKANENRICRDLAGKHWQELDADFLKTRWSSFCYLSASGYRYYLPALLMSSLEPFSPDNDLLHSTLFSLPPSYYRLYWERTDLHFKYQISLFNLAQYEAVCAFLGLGLIVLSDHYYFLCAEALRWGWNKRDNPASVSCREFYHQMHHYTYPASEDAAIQALIVQIRDAFADTQYPGDYELCGSRQGDEPAEYALEFQGLDWRTTHPRLLAEHYPSLSFFSDAGFRYFLPAYLIESLLVPELELESNANPVFHLTHGFTESESDYDPRPSTDWFTYAVQRLSYFSVSERKAIIAYLGYMGDLDDFAREDIAQALDRYWLPSLAA